MGLWSKKRDVPCLRAGVFRDSGLCSAALPTHPASPCPGGDGDLRRVWRSGRYVGTNEGWDEFVRWLAEVDELLGRFSSFEGHYCWRRPSSGLPETAHRHGVQRHSWEMWPGFLYVYAHTHERRVDGAVMWCSVAVRHGSILRATSGNVGWFEAKPSPRVNGCNGRAAPGARSGAAYSQRAAKKSSSGSQAWPSWPSTVPGPASSGPSGSPAMMPYRAGLSSVWASGNALNMLLFLSRRAVGRGVRLWRLKRGAGPAVGPRARAVVVLRNG